MKKYCEWEYGFLNESSSFKSWNTACNVATVSITKETQSHFTYCPYCGKPIKVKEKDNDSEICEGGKRLLGVI